MNKQYKANQIPTDAKCRLTVITDGLICMENEAHLKDPVPTLDEVKGPIPLPDGWLSSNRQYMIDFHEKNNTRCPWL